MNAPLAVLVCGSVDDGKSTVIGRLLVDCGGVMEGEGAAELAHLTDGLEAEREQCITIDVAHRQFHTGRRRVRLLDCPGHEQYTRNMATGASQADLAVVLVDAVAGVRQQTRRHVLIAGLMGVRSFVFVVNKMDLVGFDPRRFEALAGALRGLAPGAVVVPAVALGGEGVTRAGGGLGWFEGPTLLEVLDEAEMAAPVARAFRMPVQLVLRGADGARWLAGTVVSGTVGVGERVAASGGALATVARILGVGGAQEVAVAGEAVSVELAEARDVGRGAVLCAAGEPVGVADQFQAHVVWCGDAPLVPGRRYLFKVGTAVVAGSVNRIRHAVDIDTGLPLAAKTLGLNDVGVVHVSLAGGVAFERFSVCQALGGFVVIDRASGATLGAGTIDFALTRSDNVAWQDVTVDRAGREGLLGQRGVVVWFTGLSGAGKSTLANRVEALLHGRGRATYLLDGDNLRHGLNRDLGFTEADRVENVRRVGEVAALMADAGLIVLVCLISPYRADRAAARERVGAGFVEVFVDAPVDECRRRDPKGLYGRADRGEIPNFTGVSAPYEVPEAAEVHLRTDREGVEEGAAKVLGWVLG